MHFSKVIQVTRYLFKNSFVQNLAVTTYLYEIYAKRVSKSLDVVDGIVQIHFRGLDVEMNVDFLGVEPSFIEGTFEKREIEIFLSKLANYDLIVDVGANVGVYSLLALNSPHFQGSIVAYEPLLETFKILQRNVNKYQQAKTVSLVQKAVADTVGFIEIINSQIPASVSIEKRQNLSEIRSSVAQIQVTTLDIELQESNFDLSRAFIKVDVEGAEPLVILGAHGILTRFKPDLLLEVSKLNSENVGCSWNEAAQLLGENYSHCLIIGPRGISQSTLVYESIIQITSKSGIHTLFLSN
jgi:FkbM family methyltransferase